MNKRSSQKQTGNKAMQPNKTECRRSVRSSSLSRRHSLMLHGEQRELTQLSPRQDGRLSRPAFPKRQRTDRTRLALFSKVPVAALG